MFLSKSGHRLSFSNKLDAARCAINLQIGNSHIRQQDVITSPWDVRLTAPTQTFQPKKGSVSTMMNRVHGISHFNATAQKSDTPIKAPRN